MENNKEYVIRYWNSQYVISNKTDFQKIAKLQQSFERVMATVYYSKKIRKDDFKVTAYLLNLAYIDALKNVKKIKWTDRESFIVAHDIIRRINKRYDVWLKAQRRDAKKMTGLVF